jgi:hypothetical protein
MKTEKKEVLDFLANLPSKPAEQFNQALNLYRNSKGALSNQLNYFNRSGFSSATLSAVLYELKKLHQISNSDVKKHQVNNIEVNVSDFPSILDRFKTGLSLLEENVAVKLLILMKFAYEINFINIKTVHGLSEGLVNYFSDQTPYDLYKEKNPGIVELLDQIPDAELIAFFYGVEYPEEFKDEILRFVSSVKVDFEAAKSDIQKTFASAPDNVKQEIKFRDQFPFLKEGNYPEEFKVLITEKFDHYYAYVDAHSELIKKVIPGDNPADNQELFELAKIAVQNFEADQSIWDELDYYQKNNKVLGEHPIFKQRKLQEKINEMSFADAAKRKGLLENYINRDTKNAEKAKASKNDDDFQKFSEKVVAWKSELVLVNLKLDAKE